MPPRRTLRRTWTATALILAGLLGSEAAAEADTERLDGFDVVIVGGSTAALAAAFTAADEGARVALLEPTDWIGGQLTASGVPAVDEAWHAIRDPATGDVLLNVSGIARDPRNMTPFFRDALAQIGNPGRGWVSRFCFEPRRLLDGALLPRERALSDRLNVFRQTVLKRADVDQPTGKILSVTAIQRFARPSGAAASYDQPPSVELPDWYSPADSERFTKRVLHFAGRDGRLPVFIDASEWGELLAVCGAPFVQGSELSEDSVVANQRCGQAITYGFVQRYHSSPVSPKTTYATVPRLGFGSYREKPDAWSRVWTYRRLYAAEGDSPAPGDLSLQNWGFDSRTGESGNDYPGGYFLLSKQEAAAQIADWQGGVDLNVLAAAERQAYGWHEWFRHAAPKGIDPDCFTLDREVLGTAHGLSKLPYIRDTRRAVGLGGFRLKISDLLGPASDRTGTVFDDRVALGAYAADIHPLAGCQYSEAIDNNHATLPFHLPYRALTCDGRPNLLVAGKTMAQTFLANSATRLHPIEWSTGCAAGAAAAYLAAGRHTTAEGYEQVGEIQTIVRRHTPIDWTIDPRFTPVANSAAGQ